MIETRVLSCHASYRCRHAGACCTAGWPIPVEPDRLVALERALTDGRLRPALSAPAPLHHPPSSSDAPVVLGTQAGACAFYDGTRRAHCTIHGSLGHGALPLACRQFPRVVVTDPRGVSITLSHFCPTAADMLSHRGRVGIVVNAPGFGPGGEYVGLDVREALPPALRPDMLMTWPAWWRFEELAVHRLTTGGEPAEAMEALAGVIERIRTWSPGGAELEDVVEAAFDVGGSIESGGRIDRTRVTADASADAVLAAVPDDLRPSAAAALQARGPAPATGVHAAFLAAHAFANWTAHLGEGLRTWFASIDTAHVLLQAGAPIRAIDLVIRHLADPAALARVWGAVER